MSRLAAVFALALLTAPALGQAPPPGTRQIRMDLSPAGEAAVKKFLGGPDPTMVSLTQQFRTVAQQIAALTDAPKLDLTRMTALMRKQEQTQLAMTRRSNDRMLAMMSALSDADRIKFLRGLKSARPGPPPAK